LSFEPITGEELRQRWLEHHEHVLRSSVHTVRRIGLPLLTMPKVLRRQFATALQDANMDPLIRNQLMGYMPAGLV